MINAVQYDNEVIYICGINENIYNNIVDGVVKDIKGDDNIKNEFDIDILECIDNYFYYYYELGEIVLDDYRVFESLYIDICIKLGFGDYDNSTKEKDLKETIEILNNIKDENLIVMEKRDNIIKENYEKRNNKVTIQLLRLKDILKLKDYNYNKYIELPISFYEYEELCNVFETYIQFDDDNFTNGCMFYKNNDSLLLKFSIIDKKMVI